MHHLLLQTTCSATQSWYSTASPSHSVKKFPFPTHSRVLFWVPIPHTVAEHVDHSLQSVHAPAARIKMILYWHTQKYVIFGLRLYTGSSLQTVLMPGSLTTLGTIMVLHSVTGKSWHISFSINPGTSFFTYPPCECQLLQFPLF